MRPVSALLVFAAAALAQTVAYLPDPAGPAGVQVTAVSAGTPAVITTATPHSLTAGRAVHLGQIYFHDGATNTNRLSAANGNRKVKDVVDATHFSITDLNGADIPGIVAPSSYLSSTGFVRSVLPRTLTPHPRVILDGAAGQYTLQTAATIRDGTLQRIVVSQPTAT